MTASGLIDAFAVAGFGARIGVSVDRFCLDPILRKLLPDRTRISDVDKVDEIVAVHCGGTLNRNAICACDRQSPDFLSLLESFDSRLRFALGVHARRRVFIHAGVVGWKGGALLLPGRTFTGKSTLVAALISAGADYISDEHAVLDDDGRVHPWVKPLSLRLQPDGGQKDVPAAAFGARVARQPLPVRLILATSYRAHARWRPVQFSPAQGALELMNNALAARLHPGRVMRAVGQAAAGARIFRTDRAEAEHVAPRILKLMEDAAG